jgi:hypothetical protein
MYFLQYQITIFVVVSKFHPQPEYQTTAMLEIPKTSICQYGENKFRRINKKKERKVTVKIPMITLMKYIVILYYM